MWIIALIIFNFGVVLAFFNIEFSYWKRRDIFSYRGTIPWGSFANILQQSMEQQAEHFHRYFQKKHVKYGGLYLFTKPIFMPISSETLRNILVKDSAHFSARCGYVNPDQKICGHLYNIHGKRWAKLSKKVKSILNDHNLRVLKPTLIQAFSNMIICLKFHAMLEDSVDLNQFVINATRDVLSTTMLGIVDATELEWLENRLQETSTFEVILKHFKWLLPDLARYFQLPTYPKDAEDYFARTLLDRIKKRNKCSKIHNDLLELLMGLHNHDNDGDFIRKDDQFNVYDIINQCFFFYIHGFHTMWKTLSFALYELARDQYVQNKIRMELSHFIRDDITKVDLIEFAHLKYLDQVVKEILRKYPPITVLERKCTKKYKLAHVEKYLEKGTIVLISVMGFHKDRFAFPNPEKFDPDRFSEKHGDKFEKHCVYLPFGDGLRSCPGQRFASLQIKIALIMIIQNFQFFLAPGGGNPVQDGMKLIFQELKFHNKLSPIPFQHLHNA